MTSRKLRISILSPGAMGSAVAVRLNEAGHTVLTSFVGRSAASRKRAATAGMQDASDEELVATDMIFSFVPPDAALATADRLFPHLVRAERKPLYVDGNALNPTSKRVVAARLAEARCTLIDAAFIGKPVEGICPTFFLAGARALDFEVLQLSAWRMIILDGEIGAAAALKMCYGGINRGAIGLASALLLAAERVGAAEPLRTEMQLSMPDLFLRYQRQIPDMMAKAYRWVAEMREIAEFLGEHDPAGAALFEGIAGVFAHVTADRQGDGYDVASLLHAVEAR